MGTCVVQLSSVRYTVKWTIRWTFQVVHPPNYPFNYSSKTSKMTPDRAINDLGTIKYLLDATESPQRVLTDAHESAFLYSSSPTILSMEFITEWDFQYLKYCRAYWESFKGGREQWCFRSLVFHRSGVRRQWPPAVPWLTQAVSSSQSCTTRLPAQTLGCKGSAKGARNHGRKYPRDVAGTI